MKRRCFEPTNKTPPYRDYGGRGITVCDRWMKYEYFIADMGRRPTPRHSIDRRDNNGNYSPENCRWATPSEQSRNQRRNVFIEFCGDRLILADWSIRTAISL